MRSIEPETHCGTMDVTVTTKGGGDQSVGKVVRIEVGSSGELLLFDSGGSVLLLASGQWLMVKAKDD